MSAFSDYFSADASGYARFRPGYPQALFEWLASVAPDRRLAWDCGTGSGQAAVPLADHFARVVATDPSAAQLTHASRHSGVHYAAMSAERSAVAAGSVSLVTVAQALHWFDQPAFWAEARRVLAARGVVAIWSYGLLTLRDPTLDDALRRFHGETVGAYWPPERRQVDEGYRTLVLPFDRIDAPEFSMQADWTLDHLAGYLSTWSAVRRARVATGADPVPRVVDTLRVAWGGDQTVRRVEWPLALHAGRV
ncbi:MAG TPA: class I SAM-dependent methyltransferase [Gemmatimonadaceae bacterium]|nr:class I SAM-dependent methyltransferase [Gemmatimonadaceae bacterium]